MPYYVFQYKVTKFFNIDRKNRTYGIKNLSCDECIMEDFNDKEEVNMQLYLDISFYVYYYYDF